MTERTTPALTVPGLEQTYRFDQDLADLLTAFVYDDDDVRLSGLEDCHLPGQAYTTPTDGLAAVLKPASSLVMVVHDDADHGMVNPIETAIVSALAEAIHQPPAEGGVTTGVVTPHNAQRGQLTARLPEAVTANTVERYQGGERDVMVVSATVSNPTVARREDRFILDARRLVVAISRARLLTVLVCSDRLLGTLPQGPLDDQHGPVWARLFGLVAGRDADATWTGSLAAFSNRPRRHGDVGLAVYPYQPDR